MCFCCFALNKLKHMNNLRPFLYWPRIRNSIIYIYIYTHTHTHIYIQLNPTEVGVNHFAVHLKHYKSTTIFLKKKIVDKIKKESIREPNLEGFKQMASKSHRKQNGCRKQMIKLSQQSDKKNFNLKVLPNSKFYFQIECYHRENSSTRKVN